MESNRKLTKRTIYGWPGSQKFFCVGVVMPDGSVERFGAEEKTWPSIEAFHAERGKKAANLIYFFPAEEDE